MEKTLILKGTEDTPDISFNKENGLFVLKGRSLPEDAFSFYKPILLWMSEYVKTPHSQSELIIELDYFNSSSVKQVLNLISLFEEIIKSGKAAKITWCFSEGDDLMEIKGLEFKSMVMNIPFELKAI